jgi:hypothetical protein
MEGERRRHQVLHRQPRGLVYKVFRYFRREEEASVPIHNVAEAQYVCVCVCVRARARHPPSFVSVSLIPQSRVLLEKLLVAQLIKNFPPFMES